MLRHTFLLLASSLLGSTASTADVYELHPQKLQSFASRHAKVMVLLHEGSCAATAAFQPWLYALAQMMPNLPMATLDVTRADGAALTAAFNVTEFPQIKVLAWHNPEGERVIDYRGPLEFEALHEWADTVKAGKAHELSAFATEPPSSDQPADASSSAAAAAERKKKGNVFDTLPLEVKSMATTMVRESRLQRILTRQGGGRVEMYDSMVAQRYMKLMKEESLDVSDKFGVQEVNRRARNEVRAELLATAPEHIREEVEAEVSMGDMAAHGSRA